MATIIFGGSFKPHCMYLHTFTCNGHFYMHLQNITSNCMQLHDISLQDITYNYIYMSLHTFTHNYKPLHGTCNGI